MGSLYIVVVSSFSTKVTSHDGLKSKYIQFLLQSTKSSVKLSAKKAYNNKIDFKNYK